MQGESAVIQSRRVYTSSVVQEASEASLVLTARELSVYHLIPEKRKKDWLLGRIAAKQAVAAFLLEATGQPVTDKMIEITSEGRPQASVWQDSELVEVGAHLSISHCRGAAVAEVVGKDVARGIGVDLEFIRMFHPNTIGAFLTEREYKIYQFLPDQEKPAFCTRLWCLKEAYGKAMGVGLRIHPQQIEIDGDQSGQIVLRHNGQETGASAQWTSGEGLYILATIIV